MRISTFILVALFSFFWAGCCSLVRECLEEQGQTVIRVRPDESGRLTVDPYSAAAFRETTVRWYGGDVTLLRIDWQRPRYFAREREGSPVSLSATCEGTHCFVEIPEDIEYGRYPYYLYYRTAGGREGRINQPELDIR